MDMTDEQFEQAYAEWQDSQQDQMYAKPRGPEQMPDGEEWAGYVDIYDLTNTTQDEIDELFPLEQRKDN